LNRPHVTDDTYEDVLRSIPAGAVGLDLGSRARVRPDAITLDIEAAEGVDVVGDGHDLPWPDDTFDYIWCNAVLEHVRNPFGVASEIVRTLRPGGTAFVQVPFLENVHGWPDDYFRFTLNGLRELFADLDEVAAGTSAGPGQVLPDLLQYYGTGFSDIQGGGLFVNLLAVLLGVLTLPFRFLDRALTGRPSYWKWARGYYYIGRKRVGDRRAAKWRAAFLMPDVRGTGFDEIMRLRARDMVASLKGAGVDVETRGTVSSRVDFVTAPNLNYLLLAPPVDADKRVLVWDDPLGALALWLAQMRGGRLGFLNERSEGVLERFGALMTHRGDLHFSWDSGHIRAMSELRLVEPDAVEWYAIATFPPFLAHGRQNDVTESVDVAFCGNVYESAVALSNFTADPFWVELTRRICDRRLADLHAPAWRAFLHELGALPQSDRSERGLDPDSSVYWDFYLYAVWLAATTEVRTRLLIQVERPVHLYGIFADPGSVDLLKRHPNLVYAGNVHHYRELPQTFASTKVNVCIANGLINQGVPSKLIDCLASGGFALTDPKDDLVRLFGRDIEAIVFRDSDELNTKIEYYLERPAERREIVATLRKTIEDRCTLDALWQTVLSRVEG
jgi:SAM-dependent methyltransferase